MTVKVYDKFGNCEFIYPNIEKVDEDKYENGYFTLYRNGHFYNQFPKYYYSYEVIK